MNQTAAVNGMTVTESLRKKENIPLSLTKCSHTVKVYTRIFVIFNGISRQFDGIFPSSLPVLACACSTHGCVCVCMQVACEGACGLILLCGGKWPEC